jgi:hypothetical protein
MRSMVEGFFGGDKEPLHRLRRSPSPANAGEDLRQHLVHPFRHQLPRPPDAALVE